MFWALLVAVAVLASPRGARAETRNFAASSIIIPMDACYQFSSSNSGWSKAPLYCVDAPPLKNDDGILKAYGLIYRLLQRGITIYTIIEPTKSKVDDIDMTVTAPAGTPTAIFSRLTGGLVEFTTKSSIPYRGAPFVIDASQAATALDLIRNDVALKDLFKTVDIHVAKQSFNAPVKLRLAGAPPKIALLNIDGASTSVLTEYLKEAGLDTVGAGGTYPAQNGTVYDEFNNATDFTSGGLITGGYKVLWAPHWKGVPATGPGVLAAINNFIDQGNAYFSACVALQTEEGSADFPKNNLPDKALQPVPFMTTKGLWINGVNSWGDPAKGEKWLLADPTSPYVQTGDFRFDMIGGSVHSWKPHGGQNSVYRPGVVPLIRTYKVGDAANSNWDVETYMRKDNDPNKGPIVYLGGHSYSSVGGVRLILNTLLYLGQEQNDKEIARSAPIVRADGSTYQGTFVEATVQTNRYAPVLGHFRYYRPGVLTGARLRDFDKLAFEWDAATRLPDGASRTIFTAVSSGGSWTKLAFTTANRSQLIPLMAIEPDKVDAAITAIRDGEFGGLDHSTPAIVGPSSVAGSAFRPTIAYVGGLDGMLHALVLEGGAPLPEGTELWAFIPPGQLPKIAGYQAGVDGSPAASDVFIPDTSGKRRWRTVLAVTNSYFGGTLSVLDITDPYDPQILWRGTASTPGGEYVMGSAQGVSFGWVNWQGTPRSVVYVATNNAGTAGNGVNLYALDAGNGEVLWQWNHLYDRRIPGSTTLVPNDVPAVPAVGSLAGDGSLDDRVFYGDLDGRVWIFDATLAGGPPSGPLYDPGSDGRPITSGVALYRVASSRHLAVTAATGGADWVPSTITTVAFGVDAEERQTGSPTAGRVLFQTLLAAGERVYAAPTVAGNDVYLLTSFGKFGGTIGTSFDEAGNLRRINLSSGSITATTALAKGATEVSVTGDGKVVAASAAGLSAVDNAGRDANGLKLNDKPQKPLSILSWLDLR